MPRGNLRVERKVELAEAAARAPGAKLLADGIAAVFSPKDSELAELMTAIADLALRHRDET